MKSDEADITIAVTEVAATFLRVNVTARNNSSETVVRLSAQPSSFKVTGASGKVEWRYLGTGSSTTEALIQPNGEWTSEFVLPTSKNFDFLGSEFSGFVQLPPGHYNIQLICDLDWQLPITKPFSQQQRDALLAGRFSPTASSNIIHFQVD